MWAKEMRGVWAYGWVEDARFRGLGGRFRWVWMGLGEPSGSSVRESDTKGLNTEKGI